jgi:hypothetical protein
MDTTPYGNSSYPERTIHRPISLVAAWAAWLGVSVCFAAWASYGTVVPLPPASHPIPAPYELVAILICWACAPVAIVGQIRRRSFERRAVQAVQAVGTVAALVLPVVIDVRYREFIGDFFKYLFSQN